MTTRQLCVVVLAILGFTLADATRATAQVGGTVTWSAGFPAVLPSQGMMPGSVDVLGGYTTNQGWHAVSGNFTWTRAAGGPLTSVVLEIAGGKIGKKDPVTMQIVPARTLLGKDTYQGWLTMAYEKEDGTGSIVISTVVQFTIN